jgi:putative ABC transport system permease protein
MKSNETHNFWNWSIDQLLNDFKFTFRYLNRNRLVAGINVLGLAIGISACLVIFLIINYEFGFDKFQPDHDRVYRIYHGDSGINPSVNRGVETAIVPIVVNEFSGLESVAYFQTIPVQVKVTDKDKQKDFGVNRKTIFTDPDFFEVFNYYEWLNGSPQQSMNKPFQLVLTESRAKTYFGNITTQEMIGREVVYRDSLVLSVSGIVKDITETTDFDFTDFVTISTLEQTWMKQFFRSDDWSYIDPGSQLFIKLAKETSVSKIEEQLRGLSSHYTKRFPNDKWERYFGLQPLGDLHFNSGLGIFNYSRPVAEKQTLVILALIAILLLAIASINFINLETAQASRRAKEVGIRKALGSSRMRLIYHFIAASFILACYASALSIVIAWGAISYFTEFVPPGLTLNLLQPDLSVFLGSCILVVTVFAGLYPAIVLSGSSPVLALKNMGLGWRSETSSATVRKGLTIFQFSISQILIVATIAISFQIDYMLNKDLGFNADAIVYFDAPWNEKPEKKIQLKTELEKIPELELVSINGYPPTAFGASIATFSFDNGKQELKHQVYKKYGDSTFLSLYGISLLGGRNISNDANVRECLINATYLHALGFTTPFDILGKVINGNVIVGVMNDFHVTSLHDVIPPVMFHQYPEGSNCFGVKLIGNDVAGMDRAIEKITGAWKEVYPDNELEIAFVNDMFARFYKNERRTAKLANAATGIAVLISCLGLFGLSTFTVLRRTKEIGIRKVLGASVSGILVFLSKDFVKLIIVAFMLSAPLAYFVADWWLRRFAYRMEFNTWIYIGCAAISIITALLTISFRTLHAAKANPVDSLRYE